MWFKSTEPLISRGVIEAYFKVAGVILRTALVITNYHCEVILTFAHSIDKKVST